jgi:multidrug efflux pump subunit AcrA (membrane-fusion protein)
LLSLAALAMPSAAKDPDIGHIEVTRAQAVTYQPEFRAYGQVDPVSLVTVKAGLDGVIEDLAARPGQRLSAGDLIAHLGGPDQVKARADAQAQLAAAQQGLDQAADTERAVADTYRRKLADRAQVDRAKAQLAIPQARVAEAKAELARLEALSRIDSPVAGRVVSLSTANGSRGNRSVPTRI